MLPFRRNYNERTATNNERCGVVVVVDCRLSLAYVLSFAIVVVVVVVAVVVVKITAVVAVVVLRCYCYCRLVDVVCLTKKSEAGNVRIVRREKLAVPSKRARTCR